MPTIDENLPYAYAGNFYSTDIQVRTPLDTTVNGTYATLTRVKINSISNLPGGFSYSCTPSNCTLGPLSNGCLNITGNPVASQAGTYLLEINITISGKLFGIIPVTQQTKIADYKIKILPAPVANFKPDKYNVCAGQAVSFTDMSSNHPTSWLWTFPGGKPSSSTLENPVVTYDTPGDYNVTLKATSPAGVGKKTKALILHVNANPNAKLVSAVADTICTGDSSLTEAIQVTNATYQWYNKGIVIPGATKLVYYAKTGGDYAVEVTKTGSGCSALSNDKHVKAITLNAINVPSGSTQVCAPGAVTLNSNTSSSLSYTWYKNNTKIAGAASASYKANSTANYKVKIQNPKGCIDFSPSVSVTINPKPGTGIAASGPTTFCQGGQVTFSYTASPVGKSYQWLRNNTNISGATSKSFTATKQGSYKLKITNQQGCSATSQNTYVTVNCRLGEDSDYADGDMIHLSVSPNPMTDEAVIAVELSAPGNTSITLMDAMGRLVKTIADIPLDAGQHEFVINPSSLSPGIYFIKVMAGNDLRIRKIAVKK